MITNHEFHGQADDPHVCTCGKPQAYHHPRAMALGRALVDPRVLNGTHEIRAELSVGRVIIRKEGSMWNALIPARGLAWSPMTHVEVDRLCWIAVIDPIDFGVASATTV